MSSISSKPVNVQPLREQTVNIPSEPERLQIKKQQTVPLPLNPDKLWQSKLPPPSSSVLNDSPLPESAACAGIFGQQMFGMK